MASRKNTPSLRKEDIHCCAGIATVGSSVLLGTATRLPLAVRRRLQRNEKAPEEIRSSNLAVLLKLPASIRFTGRLVIVTRHSWMQPFRLSSLCGTVDGDAWTAKHDRLSIVYDHDNKSVRAPLAEAKTELIRNKRRDEYEWLKQHELCRASPLGGILNPAPLWELDGFTDLTAAFDRTLDAHWFKLTSSAWSKETE